ncbi:metallophosphoesterase [Mycolicibacterium gilvum]|uniref:metallophosphoesterase n=1 Tax=Mycolicibacterium gilvum TaxID=1804 RepID=UPI004045EEB3
MTDKPVEVTAERSREERRRRSPRRRRWMRTLIVLTIMLLLFGVPWWTLVMSGNAWPVPVLVAGTVVFAAAFVALPTTMLLGHGRRSDPASVAGDVLLGVGWVLFVWSVLGQLFGLVLLVGGVEDPARSRIVTTAVLVVSVGLLGWGHFEAMRVPQIRRLDVTLARLGPALDGLRVAVITDTHYGPINRARWSAAVVDRVNELDADVVCHVGDIADGTTDIRDAQAAPLAMVRAKAARVYVTGNHEYFSEAQGWLDYMERIGWDALHNRHIVVERGGDRLVVAGVDDATAAGSGVRGHGADLTAALDGADPSSPVLLLAHQPKQVVRAAAAGVDLQLSGHTHGGQMWPFNFLVRLEQPVVQGLSRHGERTQLYTSRGTGFWGPPFRVFAPSEITLLTLRRAR